MRTTAIRLLFLPLMLSPACGGGGADGQEPYDLDFDIPRTEPFADALSAYGVYREPLASLVPAEGAVVYELASELFTHYAEKQRVLAIPSGTSVEVNRQGDLVFPEGAILAKTFYYSDDQRTPNGPRRVIETRLLVRTMGLWNAATYVWNPEQTDARLAPDGAVTAVSWVDADGRAATTDYVVPHEGECVTCHQSSGVSAPIGPTLASLDRAITSDGAVVNQLTLLAEQGLLTGDASQAPSLVDYRDVDQPLGARARAYLHINCAHCHNPDGWDEAASTNLDLRYTTPVERSGIEDEVQRMLRLMNEGEMPFLGTTLRHQEGIALVEAYLESL